MTYKENSNWNDKNELKCLRIFKKLEAENFPRGKQANYCREMASTTNLEKSNISAKVGNFKSVAGINNHSNASKNTIEIYRKYSHLSVNKISSLIDKL